MGYGSLGDIERNTEMSSKRSIILKIFEKELPQAKMDELPDETKRIVNDGYEEYHIPPHTPIEDGFKLIPITAFDEWARLAFKGYTHLNRVQSKVFHAAYKSNENLCICAPTGCGKTNVAMMSILREIGQHFKNGVLRKDEFKIIYIAPMKALAQEMVTGFGKRLAPLGIQVREMTGDMQLSKKELQQTQMIVTTPEKWDVVTRKSNDQGLASLVKLIIIDEVHLLGEDRGPVIESIVARTLRQVESSQNMIRIVGLSATLPNYEDVATFLRVNPQKGLFYFNNSYRPVPLKQQFIGVTVDKQPRERELYTEICYKKVIESLREGNQVMVFVNSRKETHTTVEDLIRLVKDDTAHQNLFKLNKEPERWVIKEIDRSKNKHVKDFYPYACSIHHAGMLRNDRNLVEKLFSEGHIRVLVCTATLAWGVNLPAHTVIIKGTRVYNQNKGDFEDIGMLDVMQIFGRAGRPQFDTLGEGIIITSYKMLPRYLSLLNHALPIESSLSQELPDHLNAEICLGTITNMREAIQWLNYSYLYIRMLKNPMAYGITEKKLSQDPTLGGHRRELIEKAAKVLDECKMIRYNEESQTFASTDFGRIASHYYVSHETIELFNEKLHKDMNENQILQILSDCKEFSNIKVRDDEEKELEILLNNCPVPCKETIHSPEGKINVLIQSHISESFIKTSSLISDLNYITQSVGRIVRAMFEIVLRNGWISMADKLLTLNKCVEKKLWAYYSPLRQFSPTIPWTIMERIEGKKLSIEQIAEMESGELDSMINFRGAEKIVKQCIKHFPSLDLKIIAQPMTRTVLRIQLQITPTFTWTKRYHGDAEAFWIWVDNPANGHLIHSEFLLLKEDDLKSPSQTVNFTIPIFDPKPSQYYVRVVSDRWLGCESVTTINLKDITLPEGFPPQTDLLNLVPLPVTALKNPEFESIYKFTHFNPIQTQVFHTTYHSDVNVLLGSPTGSGKTIVAELAMLRVFENNPKGKIIYIAPLKALVRERVIEWEQTFVKKLGKRLVELTGDITPDIKSLQKADIVITTPEKWDGISRNWQKRNYVQDVALMILDEIHLLGQDRGPILEVIVSRMRYISWYKQQPIRLLGLSATLSNARDVADWFGIEERGLYNFRQSVRPVPLTTYIQGFTGKHYCPRMQTMNKPVYTAIMSHSKKKPVLVFVSSRRQTRLTAMDLISFCATDENPHKFVKLSSQELRKYTSKITDTNLKHTLIFGIGIHHAGLNPTDKSIVEELFVHEKIQILICTSTLAWGVNYPSHLVIIKGTEYFDPNTKKYVDYPITDVLQMMGRAGRPQFDTEGKACIFVEESKKNFYKKFLYEPFPVESSLNIALHDHFNAEIVSGTITSKQNALDYLTWTFLFRRLLQNPSYYGLKDNSKETLQKWLSEKITNILEDLETANMIKIVKDEKGDVIKPTRLGEIASYYYMSYLSIANFDKDIKKDSSLQDLLRLICDAKEFKELPVRHNEDQLNKELAESLPWKYSEGYIDWESPHVKTFLLLQAYFSRKELPISDYITDTKTVMDQVIRICQSFIDVMAEKGYLQASLNMMMLLQMILQARWPTDSTILQVSNLPIQGIEHLSELIHLPLEKQKKLLKDRELNIIKYLPNIEIELEIEEDKLNVSFVRKSLSQKHAYTPMFPKKKEENWWLVIGNLKSGELLTLKRVGAIQAKSSTNLTVKTQVSDLTLFLISDCYLGLDQQYNFVLKK